MNELILSLYEMLVSIIPVFIAMVIYKRYNNIVFDKYHLIIVTIFIIYIFGVIYVTNPATIYDIKVYGLSLLYPRINLIPFSNMNVIAYLLNIIMLVPLGFLLPYIWKSFDTYKAIFISSISFSLMIEICQLFNHRATDIDDLLANVIGGLIGYIIYRLIKPKLNNHAYDAYPNEALIYIVVMLVSRFFLFNNIGLVKILYSL